MKNLLNQFVILYDTNDEFRRRLENLQRMMETEEWQTLKDILTTIKGIMLTDMFSRQHTELNAQEKDVRQRAYYSIDQILTFLSRPLGWLRKRSRWEIYNTKLMAKAKGGSNDKN